MWLQHCRSDIVKGGDYCFHFFAAQIATYRVFTAMKIRIIYSIVADATSRSFRRSQLIS